MNYKVILVTVYNVAGRNQARKMGTLISDNTVAVIGLCNKTDSN